MEPVEVMTEIKHRPFNPVVLGFGYPSALSIVCYDMEKEGWELISIVPHTQWEHVAVFQRFV